LKGAVQPALGTGCLADHGEEPHLLGIASLWSLLLLAGTSAAAQEPPQRESHVIVYGDDACPPSTDDEIVVCGRRPEEERYRIPAPLRRGDRPAESSWTSQAEALDEAQRDTRPNSCSVVGSWGQSGCFEQMMRQWRAERRARARQR
jgi:hypothetical protein